MHRAYLSGDQSLPLGGVDHAIADEARKRLLVEMLQLAPAARPEMAARRNGVVRPRQHCAIGADGVARRREWHMTPRRCDTVALGGDAEDLFGFAHKAAT